jgi:hypothetical protein
MHPHTRIHGVGRCVVFALLVAGIGGCQERRPPSPAIVYEVELDRTYWGEPSNGLQAGFSLDRMVPAAFPLWDPNFRVRLVGPPATAPEAAGERDEVLLAHAVRPSPGAAARGTREQDTVFDIELTLDNGHRYIISPQFAGLVDEKPNTRLVLKSDDPSVRGEGVEIYLVLSAQDLHLRPPVAGSLQIVYRHRPTPDDALPAWDSKTWSGEVRSPPVRFRLVTLKDPDVLVPGN